MTPSSSSDMFLDNSLWISHETTPRITRTGSRLNSGWDTSHCNRDIVYRHIGILRGARLGAIGKWHASGDPGKLAFSWEYAGGSVETGHATRHREEP